jgi:hypothetical protein
MGEMPRECTREMEEETCYRCHNLRPLIRLAVEGERFFWGTMAGSQAAHREAVLSLSIRKVESLPNAVFTDISI